MGRKGRVPWVVTVSGEIIKLWLVQYLVLHWSLMQFSWIVLWFLLSYSSLAHVYKGAKCGHLHSIELVIALIFTSESKYNPRTRNGVDIVDMAIGWLFSFLLLYEGGWMVMKIQKAWKIPKEPPQPFNEDPTSGDFIKWGFIVYGACLVGKVLEINLGSVSNSQVVSHTNS